MNSPFFVTVTQSQPTFGGFSLVSQTDGVHGAPDGWSSTAVMNPVQPGSTLKRAVLCSTSVTPQTVVASTSLSPAGTGSATALCPDGGVALSGGVASEGPISTRVLAFEPTFATGALGTLPEGAGPPPNGWTATVRNDGSAEYGIKVAAICASSDGSGRREPCSHQLELGDAQPRRHLHRALCRGLRTRAFARLRGTRGALRRRRHARPGRAPKGLTAQRTGRMFTLSVSGSKTIRASPREVREHAVVLLFNPESIGRLFESEARKWMPNDWAQLFHKAGAGSARRDLLTIVG